MTIGRMRPQVPNQRPCPEVCVILEEVVLTPKNIGLIGNLLFLLAIVIGFIALKSGLHGMTIMFVMFGAFLPAIIFAVLRVVGVIKVRR